MNGEGFAYFRWHQLRNATPYISRLRDCQYFGCLSEWNQLQTQKRARPC